MKKNNKRVEYSEFQVGDIIYCTEDDFGEGVITKVYLGSDGYTEHTSLDIRYNNFIYLNDKDCHNRSVKLVRHFIIPERHRPLRYGQGKIA